MAIDSELLDKFDAADQQARLYQSVGGFSRSDPRRARARSPGSRPKRAWSARSRWSTTITCACSARSSPTCSTTHHRSILSTLHVHLDHDNCLEVLVVRGKAGARAEVRRRADQHQRREARTADDHYVGSRAVMILGTGVDLAEVGRIRDCDRALRRAIHSSAFIPRPRSLMSSAKPTSSSAMPAASPPRKRG